MKLLIKIILPVLFIVAGAAGWSYFKSKKPEIKRKPPEQHIPVVTTIDMTPGSYPTWIYTMGTVMADTQIVLKSRVAGEVISVSTKFDLGSVIQKGEMLLQLDDSDYKIEIQKATSALDKTLASLALEKGSQLIAMEEFKLINNALQDEVKVTDLALRKPQLVQAKADVARAKADLDKAVLDLSRTKIYLPFNALILEKYVDSGSLVTAQGQLAAIVDVDTYKIEARVPLDRLNTLLDRNLISGTDAVIYSDYSNQTWKGKVVRTTGKVNPDSRMAGVIILVHDPLNLKNKKNRNQLLLDDHVTIKIRGPVLENVFALPRSAIRDQNYVWLYNSGKLEIKKIKPCWKEERVVYVKGDDDSDPGAGLNSDFNFKDKIIVSDLPVAVNGMALQLALGDNQ